MTMELSDECRVLDSHYKTANLTTPVQLTTYVYASVRWPVRARTATGVKESPLLTHVDVDL